MTAPTSLPFFLRPNRHNGIPVLRRQEAFILPSYDEALLQEVAKKKAFPPRPRVPLQTLTETEQNVKTYDITRHLQEEEGHHAA